MLALCSRCFCSDSAPGQLQVTQALSSFYYTVVQMGICEGKEECDSPLGDAITVFLVLLNTGTVMVLLLSALRTVSWGPHLDKLYCFCRRRATSEAPALHGRQVEPKGTAGVAAGRGELVLEDLEQGAGGAATPNLRELNDSLHEDEAPAPVKSAHRNRRHVKKAGSAPKKKAASPGHGEVVLEDMEQGAGGAGASNLRRLNDITHEDEAPAPVKSAHRNRRHLKKAAGSTPKKKGNGSSARRNKHDRSSTAAEPTPNTSAVEGSRHKKKKRGR